MCTYALDDCKLIDLPIIHDPRGNLTFIESGRHIPFDIKRVYYLYDVPGGAERGDRGPAAVHFGIARGQRRATARVFAAGQERTHEHPQGN